MPFDKTIWGKLRDPVFILFFLLNLVPYLGLQTILFLLKLLAIEKRDDYQCIEFIESFKGLQFLQSMIFVVRGTIQYLECAGLQGVERHTCDMDGPGIISENNFVCSRMGSTFCWYMGIGEFLVKVVLVYIAYFLLDRSVSLGGKIFIDHRLEGAEIMLISKVERKPFKPRPSGSRQRKKGIFSDMIHTKTVRTKAKIIKYDQKTGLHSLVYDRERRNCIKVGQTKFPTHFKNLELENFKMLKLPGVPKNVMNFLFWWDLLLFLSVFGLGVLFIYLYATEDWMG